MTNSAAEDLALTAYAPGCIGLMIRVRSCRGLSLPCNNRSQAGLRIMRCRRALLPEPRAIRPPGTCLRSLPFALLQPTVRTIQVTQFSGNSR